MSHRTVPATDALCVASGPQHKPCTRSETGYVIFDAASGLLVMANVVLFFPLSQNRLDVPPHLDHHAPVISAWLLDHPNILVGIRCRSLVHTKVFAAFSHWAHLLCLPKAST